MQATGTLPHAADYRPIIVAYRNGAPVRLGDIATVVDSVENTKIASWYDGRRGVILSILRQPDANTVEVVDRIKALLPKFRATGAALGQHRGDERSLGLHPTIGQ